MFWDDLDAVLGSNMHIPLFNRLILTQVAKRQRLLPKKVEKERKTRKHWPVRDPKTSPWYQEYILDIRGRFGDLEGTNSKQFRNMFRMRRDTFHWFCGKVESDNWIAKPGRSASGREACPLNLLLLSSLAILGGGISFLYLQDLTFISERKTRGFFLKFCQMGRIHMFPIYCRLPTTDEEIKEAISPYKMVGLDGCIGSGDCTHVQMHNIRHELKHRNTGKSGFPTRSFQCVCGNNGKIISLLKGFEGSENDKTIAKYDPFFIAIRDNEMYRNTTWRRFDSDGNVHIERGVWLLVDNGYPDWSTLVAPVTYSCNEDLRKWSRMMESVRKDIECTFGKLKKRFGILLRYRMQSTDTLDDIMFTCGAIHNMLLLTSEPQYTGVELKEAQNVYGRLYSPQERVQGTIPTRSVPRSAQSILYRKKLVENFTYKLNNDQVRWVTTVRNRV
jgi:hypothetical protein